MNIDETLSYIHAVCWRSSIPGLERIRALGKPVLLSSHEEGVLALADRVVHLEGPPLRLREL